jgi:hypothetical protein
MAAAAVRRRLVFMVEFLSVRAVYARTGESVP